MEGYVRENSNKIVAPEALFVFSLYQARFDVRCLQRYREHTLEGVLKICR